MQLRVLYRRLCVSRVTAGQRLGYYYMRLGAQSALPLLGVLAVALRQGRSTEYRTGYFLPSYISMYISPRGALVR